MLRTFLNVPIMFSNWFRCFSMFDTQQLTSSYNCTLCFLFCVVYSLLGQYWSLSMGISFHSVDIPKAAILSQVFNQMEHMVLFRPVWEKGHSVDSTMLRKRWCMLWCHKLRELSLNFYYFSSLRLADFISILYLDTRSCVSHASICSQGRHQCLIFLPPFPMCWYYKCTYHSDFVVLAMEPRIGVRQTLYQLSDKSSP